LRGRTRRRKMQSAVDSRQKRSNRPRPRYRYRNRNSEKIETDSETDSHTEAELTCKRSSFFNSRIWLCIL
jgi:hypothetical protein